MVVMVMTMMIVVYDMTILTIVITVVNGVWDYNDNMSELIL